MYISTYKYYSIHLTRFVKCSILIFFISHVDKTCPICLDTFTNPKHTRCGHKFCSGCLEKALKFDPFCPTCKQALRTIIGKQPVGGTMTHKVCPEAICPARFANNALLGGGVRIRVEIGEQRTFKKRSKSLLSL